MHSWKILHFTFRCCSQREPTSHIKIKFNVGKEKPFMLFCMHPFSSVTENLYCKFKKLT